MWTTRFDEISQIRGHGTFFSHEKRILLQTQFEKYVSLSKDFLLLLSNLKSAEVRFHIKLHGL